jgi:hypothetical protein
MQELVSARAHSPTSRAKRRELYSRLSALLFYRLDASLRVEKRGKRNSSNFESRDRVLLKQGALIERPSRASRILESSMNTLSGRGQESKGKVAAWYLCCAVQKAVGEHARLPTICLLGLTCPPCRCT